MTSTNWGVAQDIGLIDHDIGFNIACVFYFATADGKESVATLVSLSTYFHSFHNIGSLRGVGAAGEPERRRWW